MSLLVFRHYELKRQMFSYCLIYIYCLSRNRTFLFSTEFYFFVIFFFLNQEALKVNVNTETGTFNP